MLPLLASACVSSICLRAHGAEAWPILRGGHPSDGIQQLHEQQEEQELALTPALTLTLFTVHSLFTVPCRVETHSFSPLSVRVWIHPWWFTQYQCQDPSLPPGGDEDEDANPEADGHVLDSQSPQRNGRRTTTAPPLPRTPGRAGRTGHAGRAGTATPRTPGRSFCPGMHTLGSDGVPAHRIGLDLRLLLECLEVFGGPSWGVSTSDTNAHSNDPPLTSRTRPPARKSAVPDVFHDRKSTSRTAFVLSLEEGSDAVSLKCVMPSPPPRSLPSSSFLISFCAPAPAPIPWLLHFCALFLCTCSIHV